jgi:hypothetical protein
MKKPFLPEFLPSECLLIACSSHEERCEGISIRKGAWNPRSVLLFHYKDSNPKREKRHENIRKAHNCPVVDLSFDEHDPVEGFRANIETLDGYLRDCARCAVAIDISTFTRRHLLMTLRWLDDRGQWDNLYVLYTEPEDYQASRFIPLSFGISSMRELPGFCASADASRSLQLIIFLGYEGDRALAVYDQVQPQQTTLVIPYPPFKKGWKGRTEAFNTELIKLVGEHSVVKADALDPAATNSLLEEQSARKDSPNYGRIICPLGTKPQAVGVYEYIRTCKDPPTIIYASPLRHNHDFYSYGLGPSWILKQGSRDS